MDKRYVIMKKMKNHLDSGDLLSARALANRYSSEWVAWRRLMSVINRLPREIHLQYLKQAVDESLVIMQNEEIIVALISADGRVGARSNFKTLPTVIVRSLANFLH